MKARLGEDRSRRGSRARRRRAVALVAVTVVVGALVALAGQVRGMQRAHDSRRAAEAALAEARADETGSAVALATERRAHRGIRAIVEGIAGATEEAAARRDDHLARQAEQEVAIAEARAGTADGDARLERLAGILGLQRSAMGPLARCLDGVQRANRALGRDGHADATAALGEVSGSCRSARGGSRPAHPHDFPDPDVVVGPDERFWAYATNSTSGHVQLLSSADLAEWRLEGGVLEALPPWAEAHATWAPAAARTEEGWVLYYTVRERASALQCISVAEGPHPAGPFEDTSAGPLVCERAEGGSIDPEPVVDAGGRMHLLWKTELDTLGRPAELRGAALTADGTAIEGTATTLLAAGGGWEGDVIEGPAMVVHGDTAHLLYSGGSWNSAGYAVGAARCETVLGPCARTSSDPVLESDDRVVGPGGLSVFETDVGTGVAYHAWSPDAVGWPEPRCLHVGHARVVDGRVEVDP